jgi:hypothetical protein
MSSHKSARIPPMELITRNERAREAHGMADDGHARRKFYDIHVATKSPLAQEALTQIAALYAIEAEIRGRPAEQRQFVRQQRSRPLVECTAGCTDNSIVSPAALR